jgi:uncharacterized protein (UPF0218 family)
LLFFEVMLLPSPRLRERTLLLPEGLRYRLKDPKGELFSRPGLDAARDACAYIRRLGLHPTIAVGDLVSGNLARAGCQADLSVLDGKTQRQDELNFELVADVELRAQNAAAEIRPEVWIALELGLKLAERGKTTKLLIEGEEDLTALPAVILAPTGSAIVYGLPGQGIVVINVAATHKEQVQEILEQMVQPNADQDSTQS